MTNHQKRIPLLCKVLGHRYPYKPTEVRKEPCNRWDDCDIKEHEITFFDYACERCGFVKIKRICH